MPPPRRITHRRPKPRPLSGAPPPGNEFLAKLGYGGIDRNPTVKKRVRLD